MDTPAEAAARLLIRLGFAVLFFGLPCAGVFLRGAIYVLLPVGAIMIAIGAQLDARQQIGRRLLSSLASPAGLAGLFVVLWAGLSLLWTPFPAEAGTRFLQSSAAIFLAVLAASSLPKRFGAFDCYLLPAGVAVATVATLGLALFGPPWFLGGFAFDETLFERAMITAIVLVWPALGFLSLGEHWIAASLLAVLVAAIALAGFAQVALIPMGAAALVFAAAMSRPEKVAWLLAWLFALLMMFSPVLPLLYRLAVWLLGGHPAAAGMSVWGDLVLSHWPRFITGHGLDFVHKGLRLGYLPAATPRSLLFVLWYDLGILGAAGFTAAAIRAFRAAGQLPIQAAPALLAGLAAVLTIACLGIAALQIWWLTLLSCDAIAFAVLIKAADRAKRPDVESIHLAHPDVDTEMTRFPEAARRF